MKDIQTQLETLIEWMIAELNPTLLDDDMPDAFQDEVLRDEAKEKLADVLEVL